MGFKSIYLAGKIFGADDRTATYWRATATHRLATAGYEIRDPMTRDYRGNELGNERVIVESDLDEISSVGLVLAQCVEPSWGTAMEIRHAYSMSVPVYAIANFRHPVSPWLRYHATRLFMDLEDALEAIVLAGIPKHPKVVIARIPGVSPDLFDGEGRLYDPPLTK